MRCDIGRRMRLVETVAFFSPTPLFTATGRPGPTVPWDLRPLSNLMAIQQE